LCLDSAWPNPCPASANPRCGDSYWWLVAQPAARLASDLDSPIYATSFHMQVTRPVSS